MTSSDINTSQNNYLTVEMFNAGMSEIKFEIQRMKDGFQELKSDTKAGFQELKTDIKEMKTEIKVIGENVAANSAKIEMLGHTIYWGFAIMAFIVAFIAIFTPFFKPERYERKEKEPEITTAKVQSMIDDAIAKALLSR